MAVKVDAEYRKEIEKARRDLRALISSRNCAPIMLRLAWHDAGTYDVKTRKGGPNGSIRLPEEHNRSPNEGLDIAVRMCEEVKEKHPRITYADLYQLAGVVAVEVTGGPSIDFAPGRKDAQSPDDGELPDPDGDASHLREIFYRMGLSDRDVVALSGGHTLGKAHGERSGYDGAWTMNPLKFDNSYFMELLKGVDPEMLQLETDKALVIDPRFQRYVKLYAEDEDAFFRDYAVSHKKLSELGFASGRRCYVARLAHAFRVVVAITVLVIGIYFEVSRRGKERI